MAAAVEVRRVELDETVFIPCPLPVLEKLAVIRSTDGGRSWHPPVIASGDSDWIRTPTRAVNGDGVLAVAWHDRTADAQRVCGRVRIAFSADGGESFGEPRTVATEDSCPEQGRNGEITDRWPTGGDYFGMAPVADGSFHLVWP